MKSHEIHNVAELIKALRYCSDNEKQDGCDECPYLHNGMCHTMLSDAAYALEADERLLDLNTKRCEALRKQLKESHENYKKHLNELETQIPKEGEWIEVNKIETYCSNCNWASYSMLVQKDAFLLRNNKTKYCPNCGAKMRTVTECHTLESDR